MNLQKRFTGNIAKCRIFVFCEEIIRHFIVRRMRIGITDE